MVEHRLCTAVVSGSNPLTSTIKNKMKYFVIKTSIISNSFCVKFKELRVYGEYLGIQKRRRTWLPTICFGELETSYDPEVSE